MKRCDLCGAPLALSDEYVVRCDYCRHENRLVSKEVEDNQRRAAAVTRAAAEAKELASKLEQRSQERKEAFQAAIETFASDRTAKNGAELLRSYEAMLRIHQAPSVHMAQSMGAAGQQLLTEIDASVESAVAEFAHENQIDR